MNRVKVEGHTDLVRDMNSGAVISINSTEAENARQRKYRQQLEEQEQRELKSDVDQLKNDISVIKDLLTKLAEK
jgi:hypothetical protein|tara:strand:+ start:505 stop:726 length:222 start_codon:yes stop_codon:yes gene_type:complete